MNALGGIAHADFLEHADGALQRLFAIGLTVNQQGFYELFGNPKVRIE